MPDLIDRKALLKELRADYKDAIKDPGEGQLIAIGLESAIGIVKDAPAVASPVVHGRWKYYKKKGIAVCTECSFERKLDDDFGRAVSCPNCGARMDKEE